MRWSDAHRAAMVAAAETHEDLGLDTFQRVDVFAAMHAAGLKVIFRPLECAAVYLPAADGARPGAIINVAHPLALQRYSASHELGHHVLGHGAHAVREAQPSPTSTRLSEQEMLAEAFAAWFLMPPEAVEQTLALAGLGAPTSPADVYGLALRLGTSYEAACVHLPSLKLISLAQSKRWGEMSLKSIKRGLTSDPPPGGWRNDVWLLSARDRERRLVVRCGDRLLLPAGGCEVHELPPGASSALLSPVDLQGCGHIAVDLAATMDTGPAAIALTASGVDVEYALDVERPRSGRYIPGPGVTA